MSEWVSEGKQECYKQWKVQRVVSKKQLQGVIEGNHTFMRGATPEESVNIRETSRGQIFPDNPVFQTFEF